jgi:hypothetical protein
VREALQPVFMMVFSDFYGTAKYDRLDKNMYIGDA